MKDYEKKAERMWDKANQIARVYPMKPDDIISCMRLASTIIIKEEEEEFIRDAFVIAACEVSPYGTDPVDFLTDILHRARRGFPEPKKSAWEAFVGANEELLEAIWESWPWRNLWKLTIWLNTKLGG